LAAEQGHTNAKNMPGVVLINTNGNFDAAYKPICEAADKGNDAAIGNLPVGIRGSVGNLSGRTIN